MKINFARLPPLMMLATVLTLTACQQTTKTAVNSSVCSIFPAITYSVNDTPETAIQIRRHNAGRDQLCD